MRPQVSLPVVAGTVVNVKPAFAFVDLNEASCTKMHRETTDKRVYFQTSEVRAPPKLPADGSKGRSAGPPCRTVRH